MSQLTQKGFKKDKLSERILNEINQLLRSELKDPRLTFVSVTRVELADDYSWANIFWDTFDSSKRGDAHRAMEKCGGTVRSRLAKILKIRRTPELRFFYDSQFEDEKHISDLLAGLS